MSLLLLYEAIKYESEEEVEMLLSLNELDASEENNYAWQIAYAKDNQNILKMLENEPNVAATLPDFKKQIGYLYLVAKNKTKAELYDALNPTYRYGDREMRKLYCIAIKRDKSIAKDMFKCLRDFDRNRTGHPIYDFDFSFGENKLYRLAVLHEKEDVMELLMLEPCVLQKEREILCDV